MVVAVFIVVFIVATSPRSHNITAVADVVSPIVKAAIDLIIDLPRDEITVVAMREVKSEISPLR